MGVATGMSWPFTAGAVDRARPKRVALLSVEDGIGCLRERFYALRQHLAAQGKSTTSAVLAENLALFPVAFDLVSRRPCYPPAATSYTRTLLEILESTGPYEFVVIDPLTAFSPSMWDKPSVVAATYEVLRDMAIRSGGAVLVTFPCRPAVFGPEDLLPNVGDVPSHILDRCRWAGVLSIMAEPTTDLWANTRPYKGFEHIPVDLPSRVCLRIRSDFVAYPSEADASGMWHGTIPVLHYSRGDEGILIPTR